MKNPGRLTKCISSAQSQPSYGKASARWRAPNINYPKQKRFCQTKEDFHEEYGLSLEGVNPRCLTDEDIPEEQWVTVFTHKHVNNEKIHLKLVRPEFYEECVLLYHMVYQRIPPNHEITLKFARGFAFEKCRSAQSPTKKVKHKVAWALFAEKVIANVTLSKMLETKMDMWRKKNSPRDASALSASHIKQNRLDTSPKSAPSQSVHPFSRYDKAYYPQPACLVHTDLAVNMLTAATKKLQEKTCLVSDCRSAIDEAKTRRDKAEGVRGAAEALLQKINKTKEELKILEGEGDEASIWKRRAEILGCQVAFDLLGPDVCSSTLGKAVDELQDCHNHLLKELEEANVQFSFVKDLVNQVEKRQVPTLALVPPTTHHSVKGTLIIQNECVACGLSIEDSEVVSVYMLPCRHPYHPLCFATLCYAREECAQIGCSQTISESTRQRLFGGHEKHPKQSVLKEEVPPKTKAGRRPAKAPLSRKHEISQIRAFRKPDLQPEPLPIATDGAGKAVSNGAKDGGNILLSHFVVGREADPNNENGTVEVEFERGNCIESLLCSPNEGSAAQSSVVAATANVEKENMLQHVNALPSEDQDTLYQHMTLSQMANMGGIKKRKGAQRGKTSKRKNILSMDMAT